MGCAYCFPRRPGLGRVLLLLDIVPVPVSPCLFTSDLPRLSIILYRWPDLVPQLVDTTGHGDCYLFQEFTKRNEINLRGLDCAIDTVNNETVCYVGKGGKKRQYCSPQITPAYLTNADGQPLCQPEVEETNFCTVTCTPNGESHWKVHNKTVCNHLPGQCPLKPTWQPATSPLPVLEPTSAVPKCRLDAGGMWATADPLDFWTTSGSSLKEYSSHMNVEHMQSTELSEITVVSEFCLLLCIEFRLHLRPTKTCALF